MMTMKKRVAILGSTGSIGCQALEIIERYPNLFEAEVLTANNNTSLLIEQAIKFNVNAVVIADESKYSIVSNALDKYDIKVFCGIESIESLVCSDNIDIVLTAMVGFSGVKPTLAAIKAGKRVALANKETLVAAGSIVMNALKNSSSHIIPVDSEHSAIFQCLQGEYNLPDKILLTASGGPFLNWDKDKIREASIEEALNHPKWSMGKKVTIDSASMMNKGLEMIEAKWLFDVAPSQIEMVVHPQSIIHSMVQFKDGSITAQLSNPDMRLPIQYSFTYPNRLDSHIKKIDFKTLMELNFSKPDTDKFPCIRIAYEAIEMGGNIPCAMNAANECAVELFLDNSITFGEISKIIEQTIKTIDFVKEPSLEEILLTDKEARKIAYQIITKK